MKTLSIAYQNVKAKIVKGCKIIYYRIKLKTPKVANRVRIVSGVVGGYFGAVTSAGFDYNVIIHGVTVSISKVGAAIGVIGTIAGSLAVQNPQDLANAVNGTSAVTPSTTDNSVTPTTGSTSS